MTNKEKAFAFTARSHMLNVKCNFKFGKADLKCRFGCARMKPKVICMTAQLSMMSLGVHTATTTYLAMIQLKSKVSLKS